MRWEYKFVTYEFQSKKAGQRLYYVTSINGKYVRLPEGSDPGTSFFAYCTELGLDGWEMIDNSQMAVFKRPLA